MIRMGLCWAVVLSTWAATSSRADDAHKQRLYREGPQGWRRLRDAEQRVSGTFHAKGWVMQDGHFEKDIYDKTIKFQRNGDLVSFEGRLAALSVSPHYAFHLQRASESAPYALRGLDLKPPSETLEGVSSATSLLSVLASTRQWMRIALEDLIESPAFILKDVSETSEGTRGLIRIQFDYESEHPKLKVKDAWLTLSPAEDWAIQAGEYRPRDDWITSVRNEYRTNRSGRLALYRHEEFTRVPISRIEENYEYTFEELEGKVVPESAFTLTAFGLPEPGQPAKANYESKLHYWLIGGAFVLFVAAIGLRRAAR